MIFQVLVKRRRYLLTLVAIVLVIIFSLPAEVSLARFDLSSNLHRESWLMADSSINSATAIQPPQTNHLFQQLDLTSRQQQRISQIHRRYRERIFRKKNIITRLQRQLSDLMVGDAPAELLRAKNQKLSRVRQEIGTLRFESMLATREILTLKQRQKFRELVELKLLE